MKVYTKQELSTMKMRELVLIYNLLNGAKPVKRFGTLKDGVTRILKFQDYSAKKLAKEQGSRDGRVAELIKNNRKLNNRDFSEIKDFVILCIKAGIKSTVRQASKFRNHRGLAYLSA